MTHKQPKFKQVPRSCKNCGANIKKALQIYSEEWMKNEKNTEEFRSLLRSSCKGFDEAILSQTNTAVGKTIVYDGEGWRKTQLKEDLFRKLPKGYPFANQTRSICAVVGNGGILAGSKCGQVIDSAEFVIRCNLPPVSAQFRENVGNKTDLITANPTIFIRKYGSLGGIQNRNKLIENLKVYGKPKLFLPAFSFGMNTVVCKRALHTLLDSKGPASPVFFNPDYLRRMAHFWRSRGVKEYRLSTGLIMTSLALELCYDVHLFGFWPFSVHPQRFHEITNHYYDDVKARGFHSMPSEFSQLLQLHNQGVLRLHLEDCEDDEDY